MLSYVLMVRGSNKQPHRGFDEFFKKSRMKGTNEIEGSQQALNAHTLSLPRGLRDFPSSERHEIKQSVEVSWTSWFAHFTLCSVDFVIQRQPCVSLCLESPVCLRGPERWRAALMRGGGRFWAWGRAVNSSVAEPWLRGLWLCKGEQRLRERWEMVGYFH